MKKVCNRNMLFAAILCLQLNVVAAFGQTVVKGSVKDNTGKQNVFHPFNKWAKNSELISYFYFLGFKIR